MKQINLKEYYPFYTTDTIVEVPDEVADILHAYKLQEAAYQLRTYRNKAYYSLDLGDGIENSVLMEQPSVLEILEQQRMTELIYKGLATLPEKQASEDLCTLFSRYELFCDCQNRRLR